MKERPILFSAPMVRALLDGSKKQTRRVVKPQPYRDDYMADGDVRRQFATLSPYGKPGDRLYVRETFQGPLFPGEKMDDYLRDSAPFEYPEFCVYAADGGSAPEFQDADDNFCCRWRPSIHMPRWASRILLEIVGVHIERLHGISTADIIAEGLSTTLRGYDAECDLRYQWRALWESTGGDWDANPWLWAISFKRVTP